MASINFDMDADEGYHSKCEFYNPEEVENYYDKENIDLQHKNQQNAQFYKKMKLFTSLESCGLGSYPRPRAQFLPLNTDLPAGEITYIYLPTLELSTLNCPTGSFAQ